MSNGTGATGERPPPEGPSEPAVYLDAASSEPLHPAAAEALQTALAAGYADPRRLHRPARTARLLLDNARAVVAECLDARPDEVHFTASGTHAVHLGLLGLLAGRARTGRRLVASAVEHSAVLHAGEWNLARGGELDLAPVDRLGRVELPALTALAEGAAVVAVQSANHEVGTVQPVPDAAAAVLPAPLFVDACASMGRLPLPDGAAVIAGSAHKWGGPAGVGVLVVRKGTRWRNPYPGDDRVDELGTGFENVPAAFAAAAALRAVTDDAAATARRQRALIDRVRGTAERIADCDVVGDPTDRLPHLVTFSLLYLDGEALVTELDRLGFAVASGSACTASTLEPSHVLAAMGALTHGNVRVSLSFDTDPAEVERFCEVLPDVVAGLRSAAGLP